MPRSLIAVFFLLFQAGMLIHARFTPSRYFCWAPFDSQSEYSIRVWIEGKPLSSKEVKARYRRPARGLDSRSIQHVKDIIVQYETKYRQEQNVRVQLDYNINGIPQAPWVWVSP